MCDRRSLDDYLVSALSRNSNSCNASGSVLAAVDHTVVSKVGITERMAKGGTEIFHKEDGTKIVNEENSTKVADKKDVTTLADKVFSVENELLLNAASRCRTTREAAAFLGISQPSVVRKFKQHGISISKK
ncbi:MAG: hypothetical protein HQK62_11865 [Desulfamplus sp.]|nr:hypothetical protein [Desulfamplus sp.]